MVVFFSCLVLFAIAQSLYLKKYPVNEYAGSGKFSGSGVNDFDCYYVGGE